MYAAGLRVGEVVRLQTEDIDAERKLIQMLVNSIGQKSVFDVRCPTSYFK